MPFPGRALHLPAEAGKQPVLRDFQQIKRQVCRSLQVYFSRRAADTKNTPAFSGPKRQERQKKRISGAVFLAALLLQPAHGAFPAFSSVSELKADARRQRIRVVQIISGCVLKVDENIGVFLNPA